MGRKRLRDADLPERVYLHHGAYIYKPKEGSNIRLCTERSDVDREYKKHVKAGLITPVADESLAGAERTIGKALDKYEAEELPKLAAETQRLYGKYLLRIRVVFKEALPDQIRPKQIYAFRTEVSRSKGVHHIITAIFRTLYRNMIEWGWTDTNPAREVASEGSKKRKACPAADEIAAFKKHCNNPLLPLYIDFKLAYGLREKDLLELAPIPLSAEVFRCEISKSKRWDDGAGRRVGETVAYEVTPETRETLRQIYALKRPQSRVRLFCTSRGRPYSGDNFRAAWRAAMTLYLAAEPDATAFHEHDLRATTATADKANAQKRLTHKRKTTTDAYLREFEEEAVKPLDLTRIPSKRPKVFPSKDG